MIGMVKTRVKVEFFGTNRPPIYKGRLLGLINNKEFASILTDKDVANKVFTSETKDLDSILDLVSDIGTPAGKDWRIVISVREIDDDNIYTARLLVTDILTSFDYFSNEKKTLGISMGGGDSWIKITEHEDSE